MAFSEIISVPTYIFISFIYLISSIYGIFVLVQNFPEGDKTKTLDITNYLVVIAQCIIYLLTTFWVNYAVCKYITDVKKHFLVFLTPLIFNIYWILMKPHIERDSDYYEYYYMQLGMMSFVGFSFILFCLYSGYHYCKTEPVYSPLYQI